MCDASGTGVETVDTCADEVFLDADSDLGSEQELYFVSGHWHQMNFLIAGNEHDFQTHKCCMGDYGCVQPISSNQSLPRFKYPTFLNLQMPPSYTQTPLNVRTRKKSRALCRSVTHPDVVPHPC